jgi:hypothetical protein
MHKPLIRYLVSSPYGDEPVDKDKIDFPLEGDPLKTPYRIYFDSIRNFLGREEFKPLLSAVNQKLKREVLLKEIGEIIIRTEKHGALYHPASIELILKEEKVKFGLNVAVTDTGRDWLQKEFSVLKNLQEKYDLPYLPNPYLFDNLSSISFLLEEWFEGYHEFHITIDEEGRKRLKLWEFGNGYKYLSYEQSFEICKQASKILTLYYDLKDFYQIYPWHHAAGDFVVRMGDENNSPSPNPSHQGRGNKREDSFRVRVGEDKREIFHRGRGHPALIPSPLAGEGKGEGYFQDKIDVRLTTARRYEPLMNFDKDTVNPLFALFYFFLNLSIKMRLDKLDGLGEVVWAEDGCEEATVEGFFEALKLKESTDNYPELVNEFISLLKSFNAEELKISAQPLIDLFSGTGDFPVIKTNLESHVEKLCAILQIFPLQ